MVVIEYDKYESMEHCHRHRHDRYHHRRLQHQEIWRQSLSGTRVK